MTQSAASLQSGRNTPPAEGQGSYVQTQMEALAGKMLSVTLTYNFKTKSLLLLSSHVVQDLSTSLFFFCQLRGT